MCADFNLLKLFQRIDGGISYIRTQLFKKIHISSFIIFYTRSRIPEIFLLLLVHVTRTWTYNTRVFIFHAFKLHGFLRAQTLFCPA